MASKDKPLDGDSAGAGSGEDSPSKDKPLSGDGAGAGSGDDSPPTDPLPRSSRLTDQSKTQARIASSVVALYHQGVLQRVAPGAGPPVAETSSQSKPPERLARPEQTEDSEKEHSTGRGSTGARDKEPSGRSQPRHNEIAVVTEPTIPHYMPPPLPAAMPGGFATLPRGSSSGGGGGGGGSSSSSSGGGIAPRTTRPARSRSLACGDLRTTPRVPKKKITKDSLTHMLLWIISDNPREIVNDRSLDKAWHLFVLLGAKLEDAMTILGTDPDVYPGTEGGRRLREKLTPVLFRWKQKTKEDDEDILAEIVAYLHESKLPEIARRLERGLNQQSASVRRRESVHYADTDLVTDPQLQAHQSQSKIQEDSGVGSGSGSADRLVVPRGSCALETALKNT